MKRHVLILGFLLCIHTAKTQVLISLLLGDKLNSGKIEFGLDGGWSLSNLKNLYGANNLSNFNLGFYFDFKMKNPAWMINTGVIVKSTLGARGIPVYALGNADLDNSFKMGTVKRTINYFNVPILMKYNFKNHIYVKGGVQLGLRYKAFDEFSNDIHGGDLAFKVKIKDNFHPLDAGFAAGIGYRLNKWNGVNIGIQYYYGFVDVVIDDSTPSQFNRALYVNVGIPIGKKKAEIKTEMKAEKKQQAEMLQK